jgi:hypothetical protein
MAIHHSHGRRLAWYALATENASKIRISANAQRLEEEEDYGRVWHVKFRDVQVTAKVRSVAG